MRLGKAVVAAALVVIACPAFAQRGETLTDSDRKFFYELSDAIKRDDVPWLAAHTSLPITVRIDGKRTVIKTRGELIAHIDQIFDAKVKQAVSSQSVNSLFKNWRGLMIDHGAIWFTATLPDATDPRRVEYFITGINN
jgi:hypothetical protein